jgi:hypothetical protein
VTPKTLLDTAGLTREAVSCIQDMVIKLLEKLMAGYNPPNRYNFNPSNIIISELMDITIADGEFVYLSEDRKFEIPASNDANYDKHLMGKRVSKASFELILAQVMVRWFLLFISGSSAKEFKAWIKQSWERSRGQVGDAPTAKMLTEFFEDQGLFQGCMNWVKNLLRQL